MIGQLLPLCWQGADRGKLEYKVVPCPDNECIATIGVYFLLITRNCKGQMSGERSMYVSDRHVDISGSWSDATVSEGSVSSMHISIMAP